MLETDLEKKIALNGMVQILTKESPERLASGFVALLGLCALSMKHLPDAEKDISKHIMVAVLMGFPKSVIDQLRLALGISND